MTICYKTSITFETMVNTNDGLISFHRLDVCTFTMTLRGDLIYACYFRFFFVRPLNLFLFSIDIGSRFFHNCTLDEDRLRLVVSIRSRICF